RAPPPPPPPPRRALATAPPPPPPPDPAKKRGPPPHPRHIPLAGGDAAGLSRGTGSAFPPRHLEHAGPPPDLAQRAHPARDTCPACHSAALRACHRPGPGQADPGWRRRD